MIGKWLAADAQLFIFDEPTRGIDVGAKAEIFALMYDRWSQNGAAVLMISSGAERDRATSATAPMSCATAASRANCRANA